MSNRENLKLETAEVRRVENGFIVRSQWSERQTTISAAGINVGPGYVPQTERVFTNGGDMTAYLLKIWSENQ